MFGINKLNFIFEKYYHPLIQLRVMDEGKSLYCLRGPLKVEKNSAAPSRGGNGVILSGLPLCVS